MKCRVCASIRTENFKFSHLVFPSKNNNFKSYFCYECGSVSDYKNSSVNKKIYSSGEYRNEQAYLVDNYKTNKVTIPIDFWSIISFKRYFAIFNSLMKITKIKKIKNMRILDFGGYNGVLGFALKQKFNAKSFYVADFDKKGLKYAEFLGAKTINLNKKKFDQNNFDLILIVQVLEHLKSPSEILEVLKKKLTKKKYSGIIYAEVPNLYGFPMSEKYHLSNFNINSFIKLFEKSGLKVIGYGGTSTPLESSKFNYFLSSPKESIFVIATLNNNIYKPMLVKYDEIPKTIKEFKYKLNLSYAEIMTKYIFFNLFRLSLKYFKTSAKYISYGFLEILVLKIFRTSFISLLLNKK